jgi:tRNA(Ile)-lysidine synthase
MLLADDSHIIWVVGYRISEHYKVTENTKRILQVQLVKGNMEQESLCEETED